MKQQEVKLEHNLSQSETFLSRKVSELMSSSPKSQLYADAKLATDTLARAESSVRLLQFERETMHQDISVGLFSAMNLCIFYRNFLK